MIPRPIYKPPVESGAPYAAYLPQLFDPADTEPELEPTYSTEQGVATVMRRYLPWRRRATTSDESLSTESNIEEEPEETLSEEATLTRKVILCLRTAGPRGTPLDSAGMDKVLKLITDPTFDPKKVAVKSGNDVVTYLDCMWHGEEVALTSKKNLLLPTDPPEWQNAKREMLDVKAGDALSALIDIVQSEGAAQWAEWEAKPIEGGAIQGPETAARAVRITQSMKKRWGDDVLPLFWIAYSDETHLDSRGHMKSHPVYVKYGLGKGEWLYSSKAGRLVAYVPTPPPVADMAWAAIIKQRKLDIFHDTMQLAFGRLLEASHK